MRDYGKVHSSFWTSETTRGLTDDGRLLALYLLTCHHNTIAGVFRLPDGYICDDMQWTSQRVAKGFRELFEKGFSNRCETTKWVWIRKHFEWNPPENPNQKKAATKQANSVPTECAWKAEFIVVCAKFVDAETLQIINPQETLPEPFLNQDQYQEQYQEQEREPTRKARSSKRCPADFVITEDLRAWALQNTPRVNVDRETEDFRDHEFRTAHSDWPATWRRWMRTAQKNINGYAAKTITPSTARPFPS